MSNILPKLTNIKKTKYNLKGSVWYNNATNSNRLWLSHNEINEILETLAYYEQNFDLEDNRIYEICEECKGEGKIWHNRACAEDESGYITCDYCNGKGKNIIWQYDKM